MAQGAVQASRGSGHRAALPDLGADERGPRAVDRLDDVEHRERSVTTDDTAGMFAAVNGDVLTPKGGARIAPTRYADWLARHA